MKTIYVKFLENGKIESLLNNNIFFEGENDSIELNATFPQEITISNIQVYLQTNSKKQQFLNFDSELITKINDYTYKLIIPNESIEKGILKIGFEISNQNSNIRFKSVDINIDGFISDNYIVANKLYTTTVEVNQVLTVENTQEAEVLNVGNSKNVKLNFKIPKGNRGDTGPKGEKGEKGEKGDTPSSFLWDNITQKPELFCKKDSDNRYLIVSDLIEKTALSNINLSDILFGSNSLIDLKVYGANAGVGLLDSETNEYYFFISTNPFVDGYTQKIHIPNILLANDYVDVINKKYYNSTTNTTEDILIDGELNFTADYKNLGIYTAAATRSSKIIIRYYKNPTLALNEKMDIDNSYTKAEAIEQIKSSVPNNIETIPNTLAVNSIYSLGEQTILTLNLPSLAFVGNFIEVDFVSGTTPTALTINSSSGISDFDLVPESNMTYTLFFDYGLLYYDSINSQNVYGWRISNGEYSYTVGD